MEEVADGIFRLELNLFLPHAPAVNIYFIDDELPALIESGPGYGRCRIVEEELNKFNKSLKHAVYLVNTHEHPDHYGGNYEIKCLHKDVKIAAHKIAAESFKTLNYAFSDEVLKFVDEKTLSVFRGYKNQYENIQNLEVHLSFEDNDSLSLGRRKLKILHTPGHAPGHICLYDEEEKILFSGDNVLGQGTPYIGGISSPVFYQEGRNLPAGDLSTYFHSLQKMDELNVERILPSHGRACGKNRIKETMDRKRFQLNEILNILQKNKKLMLSEITTMLYHVNGIAAALLKGSTYAYLKKLMEEGKVKETIEGEKKYFSLHEAVV